jgi:small-conductance mechanosensitive channel
MIPASLWVWLVVITLALALDRVIPGMVGLPSGLSLLQLVGLFAGILALADIVSVATCWMFARRRKPPVEGVMVGHLYQLVAVLVILLGIAYGFGQLAAFGSFLTLFGGMLLGWSLQAPVSGFAAWVLVSLKRPFRPGDRVQFPSLGLVGDVADIGAMYTVLNQVGGTIGSEEAVGRYILVPNAMLFSQVVINYTVLQSAPYMLDEIVFRITYDSDWDMAEKIMLNVATDVTADVVETTGVQPYIRSDPYDYGVYLRLRYQTRVKDRAETSYKICKRIFQEIQHTPSIDLAIPFVYSYRAGAERKEDDVTNREARNLREVPCNLIHTTLKNPDPQDIQQLASSIASQGLMQPVIVIERPDGEYDILAGHLRFEACKHLGWRTIRALIQNG